jgi:uncharacterized protein with GYD domain
MPLYMTQFSYTTGAAAEMVRNPEEQRDTLTQLIENLGGRMVGLYYCFGEYDGVIIADIPDQTTGLALILAATAPGHLKQTKTTVLFTMEETIEAMRKAGAQTGAGPGG